MSLITKFYVLYGCVKGFSYAGIEAHYLGKQVIYIIKDVIIEKPLLGKITSLKEVFERNQLFTNNPGLFSHSGKKCLIDEELAIITINSLIVDSTLDVTSKIKDDLRKHTPGEIMIENAPILLFGSIYSEIVRSVYYTAWIQGKL
jgi:hypothetical protein